MHHASGYDLAALVSAALLLGFIVLSTMAALLLRIHKCRDFLYYFVCLVDRNYQKTHILPVLQLLLLHRNGRKALAGVSDEDLLSLGKLLFF